MDPRTSYVAVTAMVVVAVLIGFLAFVHWTPEQIVAVVGVFTTLIGALVGVQVGAKDREKVQEKLDKALDEVTPDRARLIRAG